MKDSLLVAFTIFAIIDLTLVGTTCVCVMLLVKKLITGEIEIKISDNKMKLEKRDYIERGI